MTEYRPTDLFVLKSQLSQKLGKSGLTYWTCLANFLTGCFSINPLEQRERCAMASHHLSNDKGHQNEECSAMKSSHASDLHRFLSSVNEETRAAHNALLKALMTNCVCAPVAAELTVLARTGGSFAVSASLPDVRQENGHTLALAPAPDAQALLEHGASEKTPHLNLLTRPCLRAITQSLGGFERKRLRSCKTQRVSSKVSRWEERSSPSGTWAKTPLCSDLGCLLDVQSLCIRLQSSLHAHGLTALGPSVPAFVATATEVYMNSILFQLLKQSSERVSPHCRQMDNTSQHEQQNAEKTRGIQSSSILSNQPKSIVPTLPDFTSIFLPASAQVADKPHAIRDKDMDNRTPTVHSRAVQYSCILDPTAFTIEPRIALFERQINRLDQDGCAKVVRTGRMPSGSDKTGNATLFLTKAWELAQLNNQIPIEMENGDLHPLEEVVDVRQLLSFKTA